MENGTKRFKRKLDASGHYGILTQPRFLPDDLALVKQAAAVEGLPFTTWIRAASIREARRVLRKAS